MHDRDRLVQEQVAQHSTTDRRCHAHEHGWQRGKPSGKCGGGTEGAEQADRDGVEHQNHQVQPVEDALQCHAQQCRCRGDDEVPVVLQRHRDLCQQQATNDTAAKSGENADESDAEHVNASVWDLRREHGALDGADADGRQIDGKWNLVHLGGHRTILPGAGCGAQHALGGEWAGAGVSRRSGGLAHAQIG